MDANLVRTDAVVVGAGLAGLAAAQLLRGHGLDVVVLDGRPPGGRGTTDERNGFLLNRGPHALYRKGPAERVLGALGVRVQGAPASGSPFARVGERVLPLPATPMGLATSPLLGWRGRIALARLLRRLPSLRPEALAGTSFAAWLDGTGLPADARAVVELLGRVSTYSHAPTIAGADLVVGQLQQAIGAGVTYLDGGWNALVAPLADGLTLLRATATAVADDRGDVVVTTAAGGRIVGRAAVVATGTPAAAAALLARAPFEVGPPIEATCLDLGTSRPAPRPLLFGLDRPLYLSDHGAVARLAPAGGSVVHVARYLAPGEAPAPEAARAELEEHAAAAGVGPETITTARYLHRMVVAGALATAATGGLAGRPAVDASGRSGVFLAGDWIGPTGHLLDAALASAETAAAAAARVATAGGTLSSR